MTHVCPVQSSILEALMSCRAFVSPISLGGLHDGDALHYRTRTGSRQGGVHSPELNALWLPAKARMVSASIAGGESVLASSRHSVESGCDEESGHDSSHSSHGSALVTRCVDDGPLRTRYASPGARTLSLSSDAVASADVLAVASAGVANNRTRTGDEPDAHIRPAAVGSGERPACETQQEFVKRVTKLGKRRRPEEVLEAIQTARERGLPRFNLVM